MKLPAVTAQTPPPRDSGLARATDIGALTRTGAGVQWQAATRAGRALQRGAALGWAAYQKRRAVDDDIESGEASTRTEETALRLKDAATQFDVTMDMPDPGDRDYLKTLKSFSTDKREELVSSYLKDFDADVGQIVQGFSRPETRAKYEMWSKNRRLILEYELKGLFGGKLQNYQLSKLDDFRIAAGQNGNLAIANYYTNLMDKHELITSTKASQLKRDNKTIVQKVIEEQLLVGYQAAGFGIATEKGYDAAIEWADSPEFRQELVKDGLSAEKQQSFINILKTSLNAEQTKEQLIQEQKDDGFGNAAINLLINKLDPTKPQLTFDHITEADISFGAKEGWLTKLRVFDNYSKEKLERAFQDKGSVLADVYEGIENDTITDREIRDLVGEGLSPTTAQSIISDREVRKQPQYRETEQLFKRIFGWSPDIGFPDNFAEALYEKTLRDWQGQVKERKVIGDEITVLGREIARPHFIRHLKKTLVGQEEDIALIVELALGEPEDVEKLSEESPEPPEAPVVAKPAPEGEIAPKVVEEAYNIGEIREDSEGQSWEYIGDNKWRKK